MRDGVVIFVQEDWKVCPLDKFLQGPVHKDKPSLTARYPDVPQLRVRWGFRSVLKDKLSFA